MTREDKEAIAAIRSAYEMAGSPNGPACVSQSCLNLATTRVYWPVRAGDKYPVYCDACAAWAAKVLQTLGLRAELDALQPRPGPRRGISLR